MLIVARTKMENVVAKCDWVMNTITLSDINGEVSVTLSMTPANIKALEDFVEKVSYKRRNDHE